MFLIFSTGLENSFYNHFTIFFHSTHFFKKTFGSETVLLGNKMFKKCDFCNSTLKCNLTMCVLDQNCSGLCTLKFKRKDNGTRALLDLMRSKF